MKRENSEKKSERISGGKRQIITIGLIRIHWFDGKCMWEDCNVIHGLEFAHAIPTPLSIEKKSGRSSYERLKDLMENPECFLLYCPMHHMMYDNRTSFSWVEDYYSKMNG